MSYTPNEFLNGYNGKILRINLSDRKITKESIPQDVYADCVGGTGLGARFLLNDVKSDVKWDSSNNRLMFMLGPLNGLPLSGAGAVSILSKGPMTNGIGSSQSNGFFGAFLKTAGYDGIIIEGTASCWVYLYIDNDEIKIMDAKHLVGLDTWTTETEIKKELGEKRLSVRCIGPCGENLIRFAGILGDAGHSSSHNGLGAVMGSKKLKAIAVRQGKYKSKISDFERVKELFSEMVNTSLTGKRRYRHEYGTAGSYVDQYLKGTLPIKNYTQRCPVK